MSTVAKTHGSESSHWYRQDGTPCYEVPYSDPRKGTRPTTLADARKLNLLPSVTTILRILHKQALVDWLIEQAVLAVVTTPRNPGEADDAFIQRVLHTERQHEQESAAARDLGTQMHDCLEHLLRGNEGLGPEQISVLPWVRPAFEAISARGKTVAVEKVVVGNGYAGKLDLQQEAPDGTIWLYDWKTTKKLPDRGAWPEHRLQLSAYAAAFNTDLDVAPIRCANCYISTVECGRFVIWEHTDEAATYVAGFSPLLTHWQWATGYQCQH